MLRMSEKRFESRTRHCPECEKVVPVLVERLVQKNASGATTIDMEMSMKCGEGHYTNLA